jgi:hypothetical protein
MSATAVLIREADEPSHPHTVIDIRLSSEEPSPRYSSSNYEPPPSYPENIAPLSSMVVVSPPPPKYHTRYFDFFTPFEMTYTRTSDLSYHAFTKAVVFAWAIAGWLYKRTLRTHRCIRPVLQFGVTVHFFINAVSFLLVVLVIFLGIPVAEIYTAAYLPYHCEAFLYYNPLNIPLYLMCIGIFSILRLANVLAMSHNKSGASDVLVFLLVLLSDIVVLVLDIGVLFPTPMVCTDGSMFIILLFDLIQRACTISLVWLRVKCITL